MIKNKILLTFLLIPFIFIDAYALKENTVSIFSRLDRQKYHSNEEITLEILIKNISNENIQFDVYDSSRTHYGLFTTFQPVVFDMQGREAELIVPYKQRNIPVEDILKHLHKRKVTLAPDETLKTSVDLNKLYNLETGIKYRLRSFFIPDMQDGEVLDGDNEIFFTVTEYSPHAGKQDTNVSSRNLEPAEIVLLHLSAEKNNNRDNYIKSLQIEKYIQAYPEYMRSWLRADNVKKAEIEKEFIRKITGPRDDYLLDFKITGEEIVDDIAYVDVIVTRFSPRVNHTFEYRYTLEKISGHGIVQWLIIDLEATFMKGGKK